MGVAWVQKSAGSQTGAGASSVSDSLSGVAAGNGIVAVLAAAGTPTWTLANYTSLVRVVASDNSCCLEIFLRNNVAAGTHSITATPSGAGYLAAGMIEVSGQDTSSQPRGTGTGSGTNSASDTITTAANVTAGSGDLMIAAETDNDGASSYTAGSGYTLDHTFSGASGITLGVEHKAVSAAEKPTITTGESTGAAWVMAAVCIKAAAGGAVAAHLLTCLGCGG